MWSWTWGLLAPLSRHLSWRLWDWAAVQFLYQDDSDLAVGPGGVWHSKCDTSRLMTPAPVQSSSFAQPFLLLPLGVAIAKNLSISVPLSILLIISFWLLIFLWGGGAGGGHIFMLPCAMSFAMSLMTVMWVKREWSDARQFAAEPGKEWIVKNQ